MKDLLVLGDTKDAAAMRSIHVDPDTRALSAQLYYIMIMLCQEGGLAPTAGQIRAKDRRTAVRFTTYEQISTRRQKLGVLPPASKLSTLRWRKV